MLIDNWLIGAIDILPTVFTAYIFFFYFNIFFEKKHPCIDWDYSFCILAA